MQVVAAVDRSTPRAGRFAVARGALVATLLLGAGFAVGWFVLTTPVLQDFLVAGPRPSAAQAAGAMAAWAFAMIVPAGFILLGVARVVGIVDNAAVARPRAYLARLAQQLGEEYLVVTALRLPDGRRVPDLVLGPFGLALVAEAPTFAGVRRTGARWEMRDRRGRWVGVESPLDRAVRDGERVRRWLDDHDRDFVVKVHTAMISRDPGLERVSGCVVVAPTDVLAWIQSLPPQRGLTAARRERLAELLREQAQGDGAGR